jgi:hypothetical protein
MAFRLLQPFGGTQEIQQSLQFSGVGGQQSGLSPADGADARR